MTIKTLPGIPEGRPRAGVSSQLQPIAMQRWNSGVRSASANDRTINIYDAIGSDYMTGDGITANSISSSLSAMGQGPVTVNINSPGGDMFEGLAIYNLLREHAGEVTVNIIGLAASAASVIAMAGDTVQISKAGFLMIHNAWVMAVGNRNDLSETAAMLAPFDAAMAGIYSARTGEDQASMAKLMDAETWISGQDAVDGGFADGLLPSDQVERSGNRASASAARRIESGLRASGMTKSEAIRLISELKSSTGEPAGGGAGEPTERVHEGSLSTTAKLAASLTSFQL